VAISSRALSEIERTHPDGLSSRQILDLFERHGERLSEATLRKYVQLGLLPRSRRVGQKGKHRGSRGIYPVEVVRRVDEIRRAMDDGHTLESLSRAAHAVRAKLSLVRVAVEEVLEAAETDLAGRDLDRSDRAELRRQMATLRKDAKAWMRELERWSIEVRRSEERRQRTNGSRPRRRGART
jgi:DNA-binding transcriptional MerR regulator